MDNYKEVSMSTDEITITREEFMNAVKDAATNLIINTPKELEDNPRATFTLALSAPVIGDLIANELFGKEK